MLPAPTIKGVCDKLTNDFKYYEVISGIGWIKPGSLLHSRKVRPKPVFRFDKVKMVGLLFGQPEAPLVKSEIIPSIAYFHHRSGKNISFYCGGYGSNWPDHHFPDQQQVAVIDQKTWFYSPWCFNKFREEIKSQTKWTYSGEVDLILTNAKLDRSSKLVQLDFTSTIVCNLVRMKHDSAISTVGSFFEKIFRYAERQDGNDPTWGFSDYVGLKSAGDSLIQLILSFLPKGLENDLKKICHFAIKDVSKVDLSI